MRLADTRPPFAGLANLSEAALAALPTPCYLLDEARLRRNGELLLGVQQRTGCKILLAQKAFSNFNVYPVLAPYLAGTEASGLYESRLGKEELPEKENHVFCAAYRADEFAELLQYADHIVFNSPSQLAKFGPAAKAAGKSVGLRVNPEHSTQEGHEIYDPCAPGSVWAPPVPSGMPLWRSILTCPTCWTACTSTPCASRIPTRWRPPCPRWKRNSVTCCPG